jgi:Electron transfer DM13
MKKIIYAAIPALLLFAACKKAPANLQEELPKGTTTAAGNFTSSAHSTSGKARVVDSLGKKYLLFENFSTDNGPSLKVWISKNTGVSEYKSLGTLKAASGNFYYELSAEQNTAVYNHVLIWCDAFNVLFGYAKLQ